MKNYMAVLVELNMTSPLQTTTLSNLNAFELGQLTSITFNHRNDDERCSLYIYVHPETLELWFTVRDVAKYLKIKNINDVLHEFIDKSDRCPWAILTLNVYPTCFNLPSNWKAHSILITEQGLKKLISRSRVPSAKIFQSWINEVIIPSLGQPLLKFRNWIVENRPYVEKIFQLEDNQECLLKNNLQNIFENNFIYIATHEKLQNDYIYKIGFSTNINKQLAKLNKYTPYPFRILHSFIITNGMEFEKFLHKLYSKNAISQGFFRFCDLDIVVKEIDFYSEYFHN